MKTLQNNFTTPEQSEKLLAMGIHANTADLYYERHSEIKFERLNIRLNKIELADDFFEKYSLYTPHWSVGRLIEIFELCSGVLWQDTAQPSVKQPTLIERVIDTIVLFNKHSHMDFSKLEE